MNAPPADAKKNGNRNESMLVRGPEPFSPDGLWGKRPEDAAVLARSDVQVRLEEELERYVKQEVNGRSFLVAGNRGSGKTTAVLAAVQAVYRRQNEHNEPRPLLVHMHGPSLMEGSVGPEEDGSTTTRTADKLPPQVLALLREVSSSLYLALVEEMVRRFRKPRVDCPLAPAELQELAAHLSHELFREPELSTIREIWDRAGLLPGGLVGRGQEGFREVQTLFSAAEAFLLVAGKQTHKKTEDQEAEKENKLDISSKPTGSKELVNTLGGALAGGLTGGFLAMDAKWMLAAIMTPLVTVVTATGLTWTSNRRKKHKSTRTVTYERDNTVGSLVRRLPVLVRQLRDVGYHPVFVVDELDKVDDEGRWIGNMVGHLKSFVTEKTFFCFLADRSYYEHLRPRARRHTYRVEYTYFTDHLFVTYQPGDLHRFLRTVLGEEKQKRIAQVKDDDAKKSRLNDLLAIRLALLFRARLHPFELRRQLEQVDDLEILETVQDRPGRFFRRMVNRMEAHYQLCVEWLMCDDVILQRCRRDPYFAQVLVDTLYYPAWAWQLRQKLDLDPTVVRSYLEMRAPRQAPVEQPAKKPGAGEIGPTPEIPPAGGAPQEADATVTTPAEDEESGHLSDADFEVLFGHLRYLIRYLSGAQSLEQDVEQAETEHRQAFISGELGSQEEATREQARAASWTDEQKKRESQGEQLKITMVSRIKVPALLQAEAVEPDQQPRYFAWSVDAFGLTPDRLKDPDFRDAVERIRLVSQARTIQQVGMQQLTRLVLGWSADWEGTQTALRRFTAQGWTDYPGYGDDADALLKFSAELSDQSVVAIYSLVAGARWLSRFLEEPDLARALDVIAARSAHNVPAKSQEAIIARVEQLRQLALATDVEPPPQIELPAGVQRQGLEALDALLPADDPEPWPEAYRKARIEDWWGLCRERLLVGMGAKDDDPVLEENDLPREADGRDLVGDICSEHLGVPHLLNSIDDDLCDFGYGSTKPTVRQLSQVLVWGIISDEDDCELAAEVRWLAALSAAALLFLPNIHLLEEAQSVPTGLKEIERLNDWLSGAISMEQLPTMLVTETGDVVAKWLPDRNHPVLVLDEADWIASRGPTWRTGALEAIRVAWEIRETIPTRVHPWILPSEQRAMIVSGPTPSGGFRRPTGSRFPVMLNNPETPKEAWRQLPEGGGPDGPEQKKQALL